MTENEIATIVVDAAYKIHTALGPGLLETAYRKILAYELEKRGLRVLKEHPIPVVWEAVHLEEGYRADLIVEDKVIIELKSIETLAPIHRKQLLTYLRLADKPLGLLINLAPSTSKTVSSASSTASRNEPFFALFSSFASLREPLRAEQIRCGEMSAPHPTAPPRARNRRPSSSPAPAA